MISYESPLTGMLNEETANKLKDSVKFRQSTRYDIIELIMYQIPQKSNKMFTIHISINQYLQRCSNKLPRIMATGRKPGTMIGQGHGGT